MAPKPNPYDREFPTQPGELGTRTVIGGLVGAVCGLFGSMWYWGSQLTIPQMVFGIILNAIVFALLYRWLGDSLFMRWLWWLPSMWKRRR